MFTPVNAVHLRPTDRAADAWFGDPVPFYWDGAYHLFYVWDQGHLILPRVCHSWGHFVSRDLVHWEEWPMAIDPEQEASCGTGSIMEWNGLFHMYYLGRYFTTNGVMYETICHATSKDLITWEKNPANPVSQPDLARYTVNDWRDGFPFWHEATQEFWMLITASLKDGPEPFRGAIGLLASKDLTTWEVRDPYWAPHLGRHLECPDLFEWNGWWYLIFSGGYGHAGGTLYRMSRSQHGPWQSPPVDTFDGHFFYAAKTAFDGQRRMIFGWIGTKKDNVDVGIVQWGGHGLVRELVQDHTDGTLWVKSPSERLSVGTQIPLPTFTPAIGEWRFAGTEAVCAQNFGLSYATAPVPKNLLFRCVFRPESQTVRFGLLIRTDENLTAGYRVSVDLQGNLVRVNSFGKERVARSQPVSRPLPVDPSADLCVTVVCSDSILEVFVGDRSALAMRCYDHQGGRIGLFVEEGMGRFLDLELRELPMETW